MKIFKENLTSKILQETSSKLVNKYNKEVDILELGCGNGNISKFIIRNKKKKNNFYLIDISDYAIQTAIQNIKYDKCNFKVGKWLEPWKNQRFDLIISDVSSINDFVAKKSPWYKGVVCNSGSDGLKNIKIILSNIENYLKKNGKFILPIISLSDEKKLLQLLEKKFSKITYSEKKTWPIPNFFLKDRTKYIKLKKQSKINFYEKFGIFVAYTYSATCSKLK